MDNTKDNDESKKSNDENEFEQEFYRLIEHHKLDLPVDFDIKENRKLWVLDTMLSEEILSDNFTKKLYGKFMAKKKPDLSLNVNKLKMTGDELKNPAHANFCVRQLFHYLEFFLSSSSLTVGEEEMLNKILAILKGYYESRNHFYVKSHFRSILEQTVYPFDGSSVYGLIFTSAWDIDDIKLYVKEKKEDTVDKSRMEDHPL